MANKPRIRFRVEFAGPIYTREFETEPAALEYCEEFPQFIPSITVEIDYDLWKRAASLLVVEAANHG